MAAGKVLVVEDDADVRELLHEVLVPLGYELSAMAQPPRDVAEVARRRPDVVLLDLHFGAGEAGWQLLERLKEHDETRALPVVICTASVAAVAGQEERLNHSGVRVMHKPFDLDRLDGELRAAIESRAA